MNKYQEAIDKVAGYCCDYIMGIFPPRYQLHDEFDIFMELSEKATPKKIIKKEKIKSCDLICPSCHKKLSSNCYYEWCKNTETTLIYKNDLSYNYCPICGQALDWSVNENSQGNV